jgi:hypothetical protein
MMSSLKSVRRAALAAAAVFLVPSGVRAADVGVVSNVKVLSDKVQDVSSMEAWAQSFIKPGMSDRDKAMAAWKTTVMFRHQDAPPNEYLGHETHPHDPIKAFNVYGYGQCCCASANIQALARHAGLQSRGYGIIAHSVPEVFFDGAWHMLDASLMTYFPRGDGSPASVAEIGAAVNEWLKQNPRLKGNDKALRDFMRGGGWRKGPELLKACPAYDDNGWLPAATHGWYSTVQEYADPAKTFVYEYGSASGYRVNHQLRAGERIVRNWSNKGLHVNMEGGGGKPGSLDPKNDILRYSARDGDLAPGRIGNGTHEYVVPVTSGAYRGGALDATNLESSAVKVDDAAKPGVLVIRMPSSYVYLSGAAKLKTTGPVAVAISDNNGLDWKDVDTLDAGAHSVDLKPHVYRRYDYRIRFTLGGAGTSIDALTLTHDIQHSQRVLPALDEGTNTITFSAGPAEGTVTVEGSLDAKDKGKQLTLADFHVASKGIKENVFLAGGSGELTIPVTTPGDLRRLRLGAHFRARDARDAWTVEASFDEGKTWNPMGQLKGPTAGHSASLALREVPPNVRSAVVRLAGAQRGTLGLFDLRLDADYAEPNGGLAPVKVTYLYDESGQHKELAHTATKQTETWTIQCAQRPLLKSIVIERPD